MTTLFLHEYVDIVGEGARKYMEHCVSMDNTVADRGLKLFGTWQVVGVTGRWPQVVNLWDMIDGWDGWKRVIGASNVRREENAALKEWWEEAYALRTGGFDRLLRATSVELNAGELFVHELSQVRPGAGPEYLVALAEEWAPVAADHGHRPVVLSEVLLTDVEVVTVWATDLDGHVRLQASDDERIPKWRARAREYLTRWREELMVPCPGSPLSSLNAQ